MKLPPTSRGFPHASLLHAICAVASSHTAWVNTLPPEQLAAAVERQRASGLDMENLEDFGLAQAESAQRAMRYADQSCFFGQGQGMLEMTQAAVCPRLNLTFQGPYPG